MTEAESLKGVLCAIFRRKGAESEKTKLFNNINLNTSDFPLDGVRFRDDDLPILLCRLTAENWLMISTQRLVCRRNGQEITVSISTIYDVTAAVSINAMKGATQKQGFSSLKLVLKTGDELIIEVEVGAPYFGIWNVLKHICMLNTRGRSTST